MITFEDHFEIVNLVARYCVTTDNADPDAFMRCWVSSEQFGGYDSGAFAAARAGRRSALGTGYC